MLLMYLVSNWVVPEVLLKRLQQPTAEDEAATSATQQQGVRVKGRKTKRKKKKGSKESMKV
jgi:nitric oxide reductase activation protein